MGLRYLHDDDCKRAIDLFSIAIGLDSHFAEAYGFRGFAYFTLGTYQEAMDDYNIALSLDPSLHNVYYFRATLHLVLKNYQDAVNDFTLAIELDNYFAEAYFYRGICKGMLDDEKGGTYDIKAAASLGMPEAQKKLNERGLKEPIDGGFESAEAASSLWGNMEVTIILLKILVAMYSMITSSVTLPDEAAKYPLPHM